MQITSTRLHRVGAPRRPWRARYRLSGLVLAAIVPGLASGLLTAPASAQAAFRLKPLQPLALLSYGHVAYQQPRTSSPRRTSVPAHRPITGEQTALPVIGRYRSRSGQRWLDVMLPGRPNSSTGWIKQTGTQPRATPWSIRVNLAARHIWVYNRGRLTRDFPAVVGKPSSPTPTGHFFVEETVIMPASEPGGPFALALSARSNVYSEFDGGPGQTAIHGRDGLGGTPGLAESHGCMRLNTPDIDWLASRVGPGALVTIS